MLDTDTTDPTYDQIAHLPHELWMVVLTDRPEPNAEALAEWAREQEVRGVPAEDRGFYWPKTSFVYRSRSSARGRLRLCEAYGAKGYLVRADPEWERAESKDETIARLRARLAVLEGQ